METVTTVLRYTLPSLQRSLDEDHVRAMVQDQISEYATHEEFSLLQSISVAQLGDKVYVLDGQHRLRAFEDLRAQGYPVDHVVLPVVTYAVTDFDELVAHFNRINKHLPIHPLELHGCWREGVAKRFVEWMRTTYGAFLKPSPVVRCPHISVDALKSEIIKRAAVMPVAVDARAMCDVVRSFNEQVHALRAEVGDALPESVRKHLDDCAKKAAKLGAAPPCYLGAFKRFEWLDVTLYCLRASSDGSPPGVPKSTCLALVASAKDAPQARERIPQAVRRRVWAKHNAPDSIAGACYTCEAELRFGDMECAHIVPHALGGKAELDNLMPVCRTCNRDMGIQNLETYRQHIARQIFGPSGPSGPPRKEDEADTAVGHDDHTNSSAT